MRREIAPGGELIDLARELATSRCPDTMIVGHEPDLTIFVTSLLGGGWDRSFLKSMVVGLDLDAPGRTAKLRFVLDPKTLQFDRP